MTWSLQTGRPVSSLNEDSVHKPTGSDLQDLVLNEVNKTSPSSLSLRLPNNLQALRTCKSTMVVVVVVLIVIIVVIIIIIIIIISSSSSSGILLLLLLVVVVVIIVVTVVTILSKRSIWAQKKLISSEHADILVNTKCLFGTAEKPPSMRSSFRQRRTRDPLRSCK